jgi:multidrug efflux pump subunit AcrA (membrane-fusion protein)
MRKTVLIILGILLIIVSIFLANLIIDSNQKKRPVPNKVIKTVFVDTVQNSVIPITVEANGNLIAKRRLELYSEVQGVFNMRSKLFRAGQSYKKGEVLLSINADEYSATVKSQKSSFYNQLTAIMPDLRLDYPSVYSKWQAYLASFDLNKSTPRLPEITNEQERYFISGKNILTQYYNLKNLEQRLSKYRITAPFTGILTEALVTEGTLVRPGQKLGSFIDNSTYELEVAVNKSYADMLEVGKQVTLNSVNSSKTYKGKVSRINGSVNLASQTVNAYIDVTDASLKEGMYLTASLSAKEEANAIKVNRSLLQAENQLFVVKDSILALIPAEPVYFTDKSVILKNVPNGTLMVNNTVPGAYAGMLVKIFEEKVKKESND